MPKRERAVGDLDRDALRCRELDHAWDEPTDRVTARTDTGFPLEIERVQVCLRTLTLPEDRQHVRTQIIPMSSFVPTKSTIKVPEDYYLHGQGRVKKAEIRREAFSRKQIRRKK